MSSVENKYTLYSGLYIMGNDAVSFLQLRVPKRTWLSSQVLQAGKNGCSSFYWMDPLVWPHLQDPQASLRGGPLPQKGPPGLTVLPMLHGNGLEMSVSSSGRC